MLTWNLQSVFKARGIERPYTFLVKAGISRHSATSILNNDIFFLRLSHLELLCQKLNCSPNDLLLWVPNPNNPLPKEHPLYKLKKEAPGFDLAETLKTASFEKLNEIKNILSTESPPSTNP
jgi:DNA-binding Xre family transcriptional regulator